MRTSDHHDLAARSAIDHIRADLLRQIHDSVQVRVHDPLVLFSGVLGESFADVRAGNIDQDIDRRKHSGKSVD